MRLGLREANQRLSRAIRVMRAGFVQPAQQEGRLPPARPVAARGKPLSRIVSEERDRW